ncbi:5-(carboxyamino)imidazole ribonucleotide synthase [Alteribacter natronophilus]|uniref:5-(carboxyamino)imidazole ribonucleotide synthase n=1 Tax=Alteribacter natronophilus TaxID=2583810 RepID=UPI00110F2F4D|nr:5-(carboxyamino)imidazole ribonucleotide synthase [Alteribacter natronophilus]TMW71098.1 5-(carboxyamino)imidazole ribonucleotide synthase [Alteribacter natronophilus]
MTRILPGKTIGILGGGQLGRMMALSAKAMGYRIAVLEPKAGSPLGQIADTEVIAAYDDIDGARRLAEASDVITYEFENIGANVAAWLEENAPFPQGSRLLEISQDRLREKEAITEAGIEVAPYAPVHSLDQLKAAAERLGYPCIVKTTRGGYDGKGQMVLQGEQDAAEAWEKLADSAPLVLESKVAFSKELSVILTRSTQGEMRAFPVAENVHRNGILHETIVPARITADTEKKAVAIASRLAEAFALTGTLAVEMFLTEDGTIYVNEIAPRPHNSGHFTMNACATSQFEQHIRAVCGVPLGKTDLLKPCVMVNILGEHLPRILAGLDEFPEAHLHLYGKDAAKPGRKMGHLNVTSGRTDEMLELIRSSSIWREQQAMGAKQ